MSTPHTYFSRTYPVQILYRGWWNIMFQYNMLSKHSNCTHSLPLQPDQYTKQIYSVTQVLYHLEYIPGLFNKGVF